MKGHAELLSVFLVDGVTEIPQEGRKLVATIDSHCVWVDLIRILIYMTYTDNETWLIGMLVRYVGICCCCSNVTVLF